VAVAGAAELRVPLSGDDAVTIAIQVEQPVSLGASPVVSAGDAARAMSALATRAAGGRIPSVSQGVAELTVAWDPDLRADHAAVTGAGPVPSQHPAPDVLVGLAWPAVFAAIAEATTD